LGGKRKKKDETVQGRKQERTKLMTLHNKKGIMSWKVSLPWGRFPGGNVIKGKRRGAETRGSRIAVAGTLKHTNALSSQERGILRRKEG